MIEAGFEDEMKALYAREDLHPELPSIRYVGYETDVGLFRWEL